MSTARRSRRRSGTPVGSAFRSQRLSGIRLGDVPGIFEAQDVRLTCSGPGAIPRHHVGILPRSCRRAARV
jgi:hypothetical protein